MTGDLQPELPTCVRCGCHRSNHPHTGWEDIPPCDTFEQADCWTGDCRSRRTNAPCNCPPRTEDVVRERADAPAAPLPGETVPAADQGIGESGSEPPRPSGTQPALSSCAEGYHHWNALTGKCIREGCDYVVPRKDPESGLPDRCGARSRTNAFVCTLDAGHDGPHENGHGMIWNPEPDLPACYHGTVGCGNEREHSHLACECLPPPALQPSAMCPIHGGSAPGASSAKSAPTSTGLVTSFVSDAPLDYADPASPIVSPSPQLLRDAAAEIDRLRAERDALRKAADGLLQHLAEHASNWPHGKYPELIEALEDAIHGPFE